MLIVAWYQYNLMEKYVNCWPLVHQIKTTFGIWMFPKIGVPKMDGENNGKPYEQMDDLGVFPLFLVQHPYRR